MGNDNSKDKYKIKAQWEWNQQLHSSEQPQWMPYTFAENVLLEKAYRKNVKEVDLGDYIVSLQHKYQRKKNDAHAQREVRRNDGVDQSAKLRGERFVGEETPRTINVVFGNLSSYLTFFQNRSPAMKEFALLFDEIEFAKNLEDVNNRLLPLLTKSLEEEFKKHPKDFPTPGDKKVFLLLQRQLSGFEQLYPLILKIYTIDSFVYRNLNHYLRNESWVQIDSILPYAYCLFKTFFNFELFRLYDNLHQVQEIAPQENAKMTMTVYRGAALDKLALSQYSPTKNKTFCWNAVTSTSTDYDIAKKFVFANGHPSKMSVIFTIEIPKKLSSNTMNANWVSIKAFSDFPMENEIILAPGSVFMITQEPSFKDGHVEVHLEMIVNLERLIHQGQILHGTMHTEMAEGATFKVPCLEGDDLRRYIGHLQGNQMVEELEFGLCKFNKKTLEKLSVTCASLSHLKKLVFISPSSSDQTHFSVIFEDLKKSKLKKLLKTIEIYDKTAFSNQDEISFAKGIGYFTSLTALKLEFTRCDKMTDKAIKHLCMQGIKHLSLLTSLNMSFEGCDQLTDKGIKTLCSKGIRELKRLESLTLDFSGCEKITDKGLKNLNIEGISRLSYLKSLKLNFTQCVKITDKGLKVLAKRRTKHLSSINLNFAACSNITDLGLKYLYPKSSKTLASLTLHFEGCFNLTNDGFFNLFPSKIKRPDLLTSLALNMTKCQQISDYGLNILGSQAIQRFASLHSLSLDFSSCDKITDQGLDSLFSQGIDKVVSLALLNVSCAMCPQITNRWTDKLVEIFETYQAMSIEDAKTLKLTNFTRRVLGENSVFKLEPLARLPTNFEEIIKLDSKERLMKFLAASSFKGQGIASIQNVKTFKVHADIFAGLEEILDQLLFETLNDFTALRSLHLKLTQDDQITDSWLAKFCSQKNTLITTLILDFSGSDKITDAWLSSLSFQNIERLTSLTLIFADCSNITDESFKNLHFEQIKHLNSLNLSFERCHQITNQGLRNLCRIRQLSSLASISLNFSECSRVTEEGLNDLCSQGIKHLFSLSQLTLNFTGCSEISVAAYRNFQKILQYFGFKPVQ